MQMGDRGPHVSSHFQPLTQARNTTVDSNNSQKCCDYSRLI
jgi:hypothetical protein